MTRPKASVPAAMVKVGANNTEWATHVHFAVRGIAKAFARLISTAVVFIKDETTVALQKV